MDDPDDDPGKCSEGNNAIEDEQIWEEPKFDISDGLEIDHRFEIVSYSLESIQDFAKTDVEALFQSEIERNPGGGGKNDREDR